MNSTKTSVIVVLGSGRSGTSMITQILQAMGMQLSAKLIPAGVHNQKGFFEDQEVVDANKNILATLEAGDLPPFIIDWDAPSFQADGKNSIRAIVEKNIHGVKTIWGIKDPRISSLLPLWHSVFEDLDITPIYILCVRHPAAVVDSMKKAGIDEDIAELLWLKRNLDALHDTEQRCCIVHYEDSFTAPEKVASELLSYTGLERFTDLETVQKRVLDIVSPKLNRSSQAKYQIKSPQVQRLYEILRAQSGAWTETNAKFDDIFALHKELRDHASWFDLIRTQHLKTQALRSDFSALKTQSAKTSDAQARKISELNQKLERQQSDNSKLRNRLADTTDGLSAARTSLREMTARVAETRRKYSESTSYRLGQLIIDAYRSPGRNSLRLPADIVRLLRSRGKSDQK